MNWCCSRYTTGVSIGTIYILGSVIVFLFQIVSFIEYENNEDPERQEYLNQLKADAIESMIKCALTALISSLFIVAIVKRNHYLILIWMLFGIYIFYITCRAIYITFIGAGLGLASVITFIIIFLLSVLTIGIEIAIYYFSWSLFKEIRNENMKKFERVEHQTADKTLI